MALTERLEDAVPEPLRGAVDDIGRLRILVRRILETAGTDHDATEEIELGLPGTLTHRGQYPSVFLQHAVLHEARSFVSAVVEDARLLDDDRLRSGLVALDSPHLPGRDELRLADYAWLPYADRLEGLSLLLDIDVRPLLETTAQAARDDG